MAFTYRRLAVGLVALLSLAGCDKGPFDVHPYDTNFDGATGINATNIAAIERRFADRDTLKVAFVSDTHLDLSDFEDVVDDLNARPDVDFVVHCGDFTDTGTTREWEWGRKILQRLKAPHVVLVGNHDFLGTGNIVYEKMFGPMDFSFIAGRTKFVCLNTNATEYDYLAAVPNFDYMEEQIHADSAAFDRTVVVMHAAPGCEQFNNNVRKMFNYMVHLFPGLQCCVYGHNHRREAIDIYGDGTMWYGVDAIFNRNYYIFTFTPEGYSHETINF